MRVNPIKALAAHSPLFAIGPSLEMEIVRARPTSGDMLIVAPARADPVRSIARVMGPAMVPEKEIEIDGVPGKAIVSYDRDLRFLDTSYDYGTYSRSTSLTINNSEDSAELSTQVMTRIGILYTSTIQSGRVAIEGNAGRIPTDELSIDIIPIPTYTPPQQDKKWPELAKATGISCSLGFESAHQMIAAAFHFMDVAYPRVYGRLLNRYSRTSAIHMIANGTDAPLSFRAIRNLIGRLQTTSEGSGLPSAKELWRNGITVYLAEEGKRIFEIAWGKAKWGDPVLTLALRASAEASPLQLPELTPFFPENIVTHNWLEPSVDDIEEA